MKKVSINLLTNVILLLAGIILIIFHGVPTVMLWGCRVMGTMFMLPALIYLIMVAVRHADARTSTDYLGVLPAVGGLCFGLVMILKAHLFDGILQLLMGVLLIVLGLFHVVYLLLSHKSLNIKGWYYICPIVVVVCGILSLAVTSLRDNVSMVVLITGISLLLFNFTSLQEYLAERRVRRALTRPAVEPGAPADNAQVETTIPHDEAE
ncbi:MAG: hypothetical protein IJG42_06325 [Muribaculaceae bacterium]|nr:hypothetical protein [Muribaculaceae bacterium]